MGFAIDIRALEIQLSAMSDATMQQIRGRVKEAEKAGQDVFSSYAAHHVTTDPVLRSRVMTSKDSCTITYTASIKWPKLETVEVSPSLSHDTTGRNRQRVTVTGWRGKPVEIPKGFIWQGRLWRRDPGRRGYGEYGGLYLDERWHWKAPIVYVSGRYLWEMDGLPRPADVLTRCAGDLIKSVEGVLNARNLGKLDDPEYHWKDKNEKYKYRLFNSQGR